MKKNCKGCNNKLTKIIDICKSPTCDLYLSKSQKDKKLKLYSLDLYFCKNCKLIQLTDIINPEKIYSKYLYKSKHSFGLELHFKEYCEKIIKLLKLNPQKKILDIGCNDGTLLKFFVKKGYKVLGVDPASNISSDCKKNNVPLINKFLVKKLVKKIIKKNNLFDVITANNVLANIPKLKEFLSCVSMLLKKDGYFIFETIDGPSLIKNKYIDMINSEHIYYFSLTSVKELLNMHNLKVVFIEKNKLKGGSFRVYAKKNNNKALISKTNSNEIKKILLKEKKQGFSSLGAVKKYNKIYALEKIKTENFIKKLLLKDKMFAYGASAGSTSMIYFYNLKKSISFLVDDNKLRVNLYAPGSKIKILNPSKILSHNPKYTILLAWRYRDQILSKNKKYVENGGKFISLYPKIEIIK